MTSDKLNPDSSDNVSKQERAVRSKSPIHEVVHANFQDIAGVDEGTFEVVNGKAHCDYDELVEYVIFMVAIAVEIDTQHNLDLVSQDDD